MQCPICHIKLKNVSILNEHLDIIHPIMSSFDGIGLISSPVESGSDEASSPLWTLSGSEAEPSPRKMERKFGKAKMAPEQPSLLRSDSAVFQYQHQSELSPLKTIMKSPSLSTSLSNMTSLNALSCHERECDRRLNLLNGKHTCPKCHFNYCNKHWNVFLEAKLNLSGKPDPIHGYWKIICPTCYHSRPGYHDYYGTILSRTAEYCQIRSSKGVKSGKDNKMIEMVRLQTIFDQLSLRNEVMTKSKRREIEQSIVEWINDKDISSCYCCDSKFLVQRKHHCRLCGKIVCKKCSYFFNTDFQNHPLRFPIRACDRCYHLLVENQMEETYKPFLVIYAQLREERKKLEYQISSYYALMDEIKTVYVEDQDHYLKKLGVMRTEIMNGFISFDLTLKRMIHFEVPKSHLQFHMLLKNISIEHTQYLQHQMITLPSIPKPSSRKDQEISPVIPSNSNMMSDSEDSSLKWFKGLVKTSSLLALPFKVILSSSENFNEETKVLFIEHRCQLEEQLQRAIREGNFEAVQPLRDAIENVDGLLRREYG